MTDPVIAVVDSFARKRYENIEGAPFRRHVRVRVTSICDETLGEDWIGQEGRIDYYEYDCGSGQSYPHDPMIGVELDSGTVQEFWREEIEEVGCAAKKEEGRSGNDRGNGRSTRSGAEAVRNDGELDREESRQIVR